jgi:hypothetical protein
MAVTTESNRLHDVLKYEMDDRLSREKVTFLSGENVSVGQVIGKVDRALGSESADSENTGDGTLSGIALGAKAQVGDYVLECVAASTDGGTFKVTAPDGDALPDAEVGTAYSNEQIEFQINDGDTDFVVGDKFTIPVERGSGKVKALNLTAVDGSARAAGFPIADYDASDGDVEGVIVSRYAAIVSSGLVWPEGITETQKTTALEQLASLGIVVKEEA